MAISIYKNNLLMKFLSAAFFLFASFIANAQNNYSVPTDTLVQKKIMTERMSNKSLRDEMEPDPSSQLYIPANRIDELSEPFGNSVHQTRSAP